MKKLISLFLALMMVFALTGTASAEGTPTFVISEATAAPGEEVSVTVSIENNPGICGVMLSADYDHDVLTLTDVEQGSYTSGQWMAMKPNADAFWVAGHNETHDGLFATLIFTVAANAAAGDYEVSVHYDEDNTFNDDYDNVYFAITPGKVTVTGSETPPTTPTFVISEATAAPGEEVSVTVSIENNPGICGVMLSADYDHDVLTLTDVEQGTYTSGQWMAMKPNADAFWVAGHNDTHDGLFATLIFTVAANAAAGDYEVSVHYDEDNTFNDDYDNVYFAITPGKVTVTSAEPETAYYLMGIGNDWTTMNENNKFTPNGDVEGEYILHLDNLPVNSGIKVVLAEGTEIKEYYPNYGDNYYVDYAHSGSVNVYFRPAGNVWNDFFNGGFFYISKLHSVTVIPDGNGTAAIDPAAPDVSATVTLTATPNDGYHFDHVEFYQKTGEGENDLIAADLTLTEENTFTMPDYDVVIKVFFAAHDWNAPEYNWEAEGEGWKCTATRDCSGCDLEETETVTASYAVTTDPTCEGYGVGTYTATFTNSVFTAQTKTVDIDPIGHDWGEPTYVWDENNNCTATRVCTHNAEHVESEMAPGIAEVTTPATCTTAGEKIYTATFANTAFTTQTKTEEIPALGHDWSFVDFTWTQTEDGYTAKANYVCLNNEEHTETVDATVTVETTPATCEEAGGKVYTAAVTAEASLDGAEHSDIKSLVVEALGHDWSFVDFTWTQTEDGYTAKANYVCNNNTEHTQSVDAAVTVETTPATCETAGSKVFTAAVTAEASLDGAEHSDIKSLVVEALGHDWSFVDFTWTQTEDGYTAVANYKCLNNEEHTETVDATVTVETTPATCETAGGKVYTAAVAAEASLDGAEHTGNKSLIVEALGHDWGTPAWTWTGSDDTAWTAATATFTCANNNEHVEAVNAAIAQSEDNGYLVFTATVEFNGETYTDTKSIEIGYYLIGTISNWEPAAAYKFTANETVPGEYSLNLANLAVDEEIKVVRAAGTTKLTWYPDNAGNYIVDYPHSGTVAVYFRPAGNSEWNSFHTGGFFYISKLHTVTVVADGNGEAAIDPAAPDTTATVTLTAAPNDGYHFDHAEFYQKTGEGENDLIPVELALGEGNTFQMPDYDVVIKVFFAVHTYGEASYTWADDNSSVTAKHVCTVCGHEETETVNTTSEVTTPATCEGKGKTTYTATFENEAFTVQTKEVENVDPIGHDWTFVDFTWTQTEDGYAAVANYKCLNNEEHTETVDATVTVETTPATCETAGSKVFTAAVTADASLDGAAHSAIKALVVEALGHDWTFIDFTWTEIPGGWSAVANYVCSRDAEHKTTADATVTVEITYGSFGTPGQAVYTATVEAENSPDGQKHTDTKTVEVEAVVPVLYGEQDVNSLTVIEKKDGKVLYRYDVKVKNVDPSLVFVGTQIFVTFNSDLLAYREAATAFNGEGDTVLDYARNGVVSIACASASGVSFSDGDVIASLFFELIAPAEDGTVLPFGFSTGATGTASGLSYVDENGRAVELTVDTEDGSIVIDALLFGDANCDGKVTSADAAAVLRSLVGLDELSVKGALNADVDGIDGVTAEDAAMILRYMVKLIDKFPVEETEEP